MKGNIFFITSASLLCLALPACEGIREEGSLVKKLYTAIEGEPVVPRNANSIFIATPVNRTSRNDLSARFYVKLKEYIDRDGRLGVTSDDQDADVRLDPIITDIMIQNVTFNDLGQPDRKRMRMRIALSMKNQKKGRTIFSDQIIESFVMYSEISPPITSEEQALDRVLDEGAKRASMKTVTGWYTELMTPQERGK